MNSRTSMAQREEVIRRTVYVSDIDQQVILLPMLCDFGLVFLCFLLKSHKDFSLPRGTYLDFSFHRGMFGFTSWKRK